MAIILYPDQIELLDGVRASIRKGNKSVLMQLMTGGGKTMIASAMIEGSRAKGTKSIFVVPRRELLKQVSQTLEKHDMPHSFVSSGLPFNAFAKTFIATAPSLVRRLDKVADMNLVFIDECHISGDGIDKIIKFYQERGAIIIGLSATPKKTSGKAMGDWFSDMVEGKDIRWLMDNKRLSNYRLFAPDMPDLSGINTVGGDYNQGMLSDRMEQDKVLIGNAVAHYKTHAMGKLGVTYTTSRKHSEIVAEEFRKAGVPASHIDGTMKDDERAKIIGGFARREILQLVNCDLLTTGFDLASSAGIDVSIECMSDLQPTQSIAKQIQKWGRALRYKNFPATIFDHAGNVTRHQLPCTPREWSLQGEKKGTRAGVEKAVAVQSCSKCYWTAPLWGLKCPNCGDVREIKSREIEQVEGELLEVTPAMIAEQKLHKKEEQGKAQSLQDLLAIEKSRNYKAGWAYKVYNSRKGKR